MRFTEIELVGSIRFRSTMICFSLQRLKVIFSKSLDVVGSSDIGRYDSILLGSSWNRIPGRPNLDQTYFAGKESPLQAGKVYNLSASV